MQNSETVFTGRTTSENVVAILAPDVALHPEAMDETCVNAHDKLYRAATLAAALLLLAGAAAA